MKTKLELLNMLVNCSVIELDDYYSIEMGKDIYIMGFYEDEKFEKLISRNFEFETNKANKQFIHLKHKNFGNVKVILT